jgi:pyruvate dehydrogenase E1 component
MSSAHKASRKLQATDSGSLSALEQAMQDLDPVETQEWLDALESVLDKEG